MFTLKKFGGRFANFDRNDLQPSQPDEDDWME